MRTWDTMRHNPLVALFFVVLALPFVLFAMDKIDGLMLMGGVAVAFYFLLFMVNFEAAFLILLFSRSSLDYISLRSGGSFNIAALATLLIIFFLAFYALYKKIDITKYVDSKPFILFLFVSLLSLPVSNAFEVSLVDWLRMASILSVYLLTREICTSEKKIRIYLTIILWSAMIPLIVAMHQQLTGTGIKDEFGFLRLSGTFAHPNALSTYLVILLLFSTSQILEKKSIVAKPLLSLLLGLGSVVFLLTYSRGAWFVFALALFFIAAVRYRMLFLIMPVAVVCALLLPGVSARIEDTFSSEYRKSGNVSAWEWRKNVWGESLPLIQKHPAFGSGLGMLEHEEGVMAHNDYVRLPIESGLVGLLAYLALLWVLFFRSLADYKAARSPVNKSLQLCLLALVMAIGIRQSADNTLRHTVVMIYFWTFIAIARNMAMLEKEKTGTEA